MKKPTPCLAQVCKIIFQSLQSVKLYWKPYLRKVKTVSCYIREKSHAIIILRFCQLTLNFIHFVRNTQMNHVWEQPFCVRFVKHISRSSSLQRNKSLSHKLPEIFVVFDVNQQVGEQNKKIKRKVCSYSIFDDLIHFSFQL